MARVRRLLLALVVAALAAAGCTEDAPGTTGASTTSSTATDTSERPVAYAVGRRSIELVDPSRPTAADPARDLPAEPDRTLPVLLLYPAEGDPIEVEPIDEAPVAEGDFPLVVFAHGRGGSGPASERRIREWARAGYVVAAPTFPLTSGPEGGVADYVNQPADLSFVIDALLDLPDEDPLAAHVDSDAVAAAGHSLGAITTIGLGLNSCCQDERIDAIVELSGMRIGFPGGDYEDLGSVPFLAVHGAQDAVVPVSGSDSLFADAPGPAAYLRLAEGDHSSYLITEGELVDAVVVGFLHDWLLDDPSRWQGLGELVEEHGAATLEEKPAP